MKKTYLKPTVETVEIETQSLMQASFSEDNATGSMGINSDKTATGVAMSKETGFDLWEDEE